MRHPVNPAAATWLGLARTTFLLALLAGFLTGPAGGRALAAAEAGGFEFFEKNIRPVLVEQCYDCHSAGAQKAKGGLQVDSRAKLLAGGDTGPAIMPGKPEPKW